MRKGDGGNPRPLRQIKCFAWSFAVYQPRPAMMVMLPPEPGFMVSR